MDFPLISHDTQAPRRSARPVSDGFAGSNPRCLKGYNLVQWGQGGVDYWASLMPDQIALDKFTAAVVALLFSATAGLSQDRLTKQDLVTLAVTLGVYDDRCEKLAPRLLADVQRMVRMLDKADVMAGVVNEHEKVDQAGEAKWCEAFRPMIEKYKDGLFEPTR